MASVNFSKLVFVHAYVRRRQGRLEYVVAHRRSFPKR